MSTQVEFTYYLDDFPLTVIADITPGIPAFTNCLPENAEPEEPPEVEIISVTHPTDKDIQFPYDQLSLEVSIMEWAWGYYKDTR